MTLVDRSVRDLLAALSAPTPTPGGGSASALAGALGASLLLMVAGLPRSASAGDGDDASLGAAQGELEAARDALAALVDRDAAAFDAVVRARRLPRITEEDRARRAEAIQAALLEAAAAPLETMRQACRALQAACHVARTGSLQAASDIEVALDLLEVAVRGGQANAAANLDSLADRRRADAMRREVERVTAGAADAATAARELLRARR